jgi:hypothetical protein
LKNLVNSNIDQSSDIIQNQQNNTSFNKSSTPLSSSSSSYNINNNNNKQRSQNIYQQQTNETINQRRLSSNNEQISGPIQQQNQQSFYKMIRNSQSNLMPSTSAATSNSLLQPIMNKNSVDNLKLNELSLNQSESIKQHSKLMHEIKGDSSSSSSSILSHYDSVDNSSTITTTTSHLQTNTDNKQSVINQLNTDFKLINKHVYNLKNGVNDHRSLYF